MTDKISLSRYPGARPFEKQQKNLFFGRQKDIKALSQIIKSNTTITLYGKSGTGKSSLINAGIIPKFIEDGNLVPVVVRFRSFNHEEDNTNTNPLELTNKAVKEAVKKAVKKGNKLVDTFLNNVMEDEDSLWRNVKEHSLKYGGKGGLLLVFDQFEELFSYDESTINIFQEQLAEALHSDVPQRYQDALKIKQDNETLSLSAEELQLLQQAPLLKILISIRTERMHLLNKLNIVLPDISKNNYELDALDEQSATDAIVLPADLLDIEGKFNTNSSTFEPTALKSILDFLTKNGTEKIESTQLQIICNAIQENISRENPNSIKNEDIGDLKSIIGDFYRECIESLDPLEQTSARLLVEENLILEKEERRLSLYEGKALQLVSPKTLASLVNSHLLRAEPSVQGGYTYELSHDNLVEPLSRAYARRIKSLQEAEKDRVTVMRVMEVLESKRIAELERKKRRRSNILALISALCFLVTILWWWIADTNVKKVPQISNVLSTKSESSNSLVNGKGTSNPQGLSENDSLLQLRNKEFEDLEAINQNPKESLTAMPSGIEQLKDNYNQQTSANSQLGDAAKKQEQTLFQLLKKEQEVLSANQMQAQAQEEAQKARLELEKKTREAEQLKKDLLEAKEVKSPADGASLKEIERELYQANLELQQARKEVVNRDTELKRLKTSSVPKSLESNVVFVKGGTFTMGYTIEQGSDYEANEQPAHSVAVNDFFIGKYEVTQKEWREIMGSNPRELKFKGCDQCPVENVSWDDIQVFLKKLNQLSDRQYRLPSEAEWEYAARGGSQSNGYKYSGGDNINDVSWYSGQNSENRTSTIGTKKPNELGIYDMSGNVWEWCNDLYKDYNSIGAIVNTKSIDNKYGYRVLRGGSWFSKGKFCRVSFRNLNTSDARSSNLGFRIAYSPHGRGF